MTSEASDSLCRRNAMESSLALHTLSTRPEFNPNAQVSNMLACGAGGGGGGASTTTLLVHDALRLRSSVTLAVAVIVPGLAPVVSSRTAGPEPTMVPPLVDH